MAVRGSASVDTPHFKNKQQKLINKLKFPKIYDTKVDTKKVLLPVLKPWITDKITNLLGFEDDVVINLVLNLLERARFPDPKDICVCLMGFLEQDAMVCI